MFDLFFMPLITLILLSLILGPLGCFLVWRRVAFFADGLSHACMLGIPMALLLHIHFLSGIMITACFGTLLYTQFARIQTLSGDTLFAIIAHTLFAAGIVALSLSRNTHINTEAILFGDIFGITATDAICAGVLIIIVGGFMRYFWRVLITQSLSRDMARVAYPHEHAVHSAFMMLMGLVVALSMYRLGALLVPALMVLPAAIARVGARSPHSMIFSAIMIGVCGCVLGMFGSLHYDTPLSPSIVLSLALLGIILYTGHHVFCSYSRKTA